jgi:hypothetical protein
MQLKCYTLYYIAEMETFAYFFTPSDLFVVINNVNKTWALLQTTEGTMFVFGTCNRRFAFSY